MADEETQDPPTESVLAKSRLNPHQRWCLEQAAFLLGQSSEEFLISSALRRAEHVLSNFSHTALTTGESEAIAGAVARGAADVSALQAMFRAPDSLADRAELSPILKLGMDMDSATFDCGNEPLNRWAAREALASQLMGYADTYAVSDANRVVAYYSLAVECIALPFGPDDIGASCPRYLRVMLLRRVAVDREYQRQGLARALIKDAFLRFADLADPAEVLLVEAQDQAAQQVYTRCGFTPGPSSPSLLFVARRDVRRLMGT
jgi:GNAT superfamily N-acetyltransferase